MIISKMKARVLLTICIVSFVFVGLTGCAGVRIEDGSLKPDALHATKVEKSKMKIKEERGLASPPDLKKTKSKKPANKKTKISKPKPKKAVPKKSKAKKSTPEKFKPKKFKAEKSGSEKPAQGLALINRGKTPGDNENSSLSRSPMVRATLETETGSEDTQGRTHTVEALLMVEDIEYAIKELVALEVLYTHDVRTGLTTRADGSAIGEYIQAKREVTSLSADNRYEAFQSNQSTLVEGDENSTTDIFLRDTLTKQVTRVSVASSGAEGDGYSLDVSISPEGWYLVFESDATNLVDNDTNGNWDIFLYDTRFNTTRRVSVVSGGGEGIGGNSTSPGISSKGRFVVFDSGATNLVPGDTNTRFDIFVHDTNHNTTKRVSVNSKGFEALGGDSFSPIISKDGRYITFYSLATNLIIE